MRPTRATTVTARPSPRRAHRRLDIGLFVPASSSAPLAADLFLTVLAPELVRRGDRVTLYDGDPDRTTTGAGIERTVVPGARLGRPGGALQGLGTAVRATGRRHDVVVVLQAPAVAALAARRNGPAVVYHHDGSVPARPLALHLARSRVTAVVCDGPATADIHRARSGIDSTVIPWCAPPAGTPQPSAPRRHGVEPGRYLLVAEADRPAANLHRIAGLLQGRTAGLPLLVTGRPGSEPVLRARLAAAGLSGATLCTTAPGRQDLQDLLHHAAVYLHGHGDGSADALLVTAMASGARIAALDTVFNRDVLGEAGRYVRLGPDEFGAALDDLLGGSAEDDRLARKKAAERATGEFGAELVADAYRTVLLTAADTPLGRVTVTTRWAVPDTSCTW